MIRFPCNGEVHRPRGRECSESASEARRNGLGLDTEPADLAHGGDWSALLLDKTIAELPSDESFLANSVLARFLTLADSPERAFLASVTDRFRLVDVEFDQRVLCGAL